MTTTKLHLAQCSPMRSSDDAASETSMSGDICDKHKTDVLRRILENEGAIHRDDIQVVLRSHAELKSIFPHVLDTSVHLLKRLHSNVCRFSADRQPLDHFLMVQVSLWIRNILRQIRDEVVTFIVIQDAVTSMFEMLRRTSNRETPTVAKNIDIFQLFCFSIADLGSHLEKLANVPPLDYLRIADIFKSQKTSFATTIAHSPTPTSFCSPSMSDFEVLYLLGAGGFGAVYKAIYKPANVPVSIKIVSSTRFVDFKSSLMDRVVASVTSHPFIASTYCVFPVANATATVMEYIRGIDLHKVIHHAQCLPIQYSRLIFAQIMLAVVHLHQRGIIHRDIKADNVMMTAGGRIKLLDFDTSRVCIAHFPQRLQKTYFQLTAVEFRDGQKAGTLYYMAPEVVLKKPFGRAVDWWSIGILLYRLSIGRFPFRGKDLEEVQKAIIKQPLEFPKARIATKHVGLLVSFLEKLLEREPHKRIGSVSYDDISSDRFISDLSLDSLQKAKLIDIPQFATAMFEASTGIRSKVPPPTESLLKLSPKASESAFKRKFIKPEDLKDDTSPRSAISSFVSKHFQQLCHKQLSIEKSLTLKPVLHSVGYSAPSMVHSFLTTMDLPRGEAERVTILLYRDSSGSFRQIEDNLGITIMSSMSEMQTVHFIVSSIDENSPAASSKLIEGDILLKINDRPLNGCNIEDVYRLLRIWPEHVALQVLSSSTFRLLYSRVDFSEILPLFQVRVIVMQASSLQLKTHKFYDRRLQKFQKVFVVWTAPPNGSLYCGDIISKINGSREIENFHHADSIVVIEYWPISALRSRTVCLDRLLQSYPIVECPLQPLKPDLRTTILSVGDQSYTRGMMTTSSSSQSSLEEDFDDIPEWIDLSGIASSSKLPTIDVDPVLSGSPERKRESSSDDLL